MIDLGEIRGFFQRQFQPRGTSSVWPAAWSGNASRIVGKLLGDWKPANGAAIDEGPAPGRLSASALRFGADLHRYCLCERAVSPSRLFPGMGAVGALGGGMSSRFPRLVVGNVACNAHTAPTNWAAR